MPVQNHMCHKYPAKSWVPSWPFPSVQAHRKNILDGSSPSRKQHKSDYQLQGLRQSTCSSNFLYLSQGIWGITLGKESNHGLKVFRIFNLLLSPALLPTPNQNSRWTEEQICLRKDSTTTPILSSQVAKYGSDSKAVPQGNRATHVRETAVPGSRQECVTPALQAHISTKPLEIRAPGSSRRHKNTQNPVSVWEQRFSLEYHWFLLLPQPCFSDPARPQHSRACQSGSHRLLGTGTTFHGGSEFTAILADIKLCSF